MLREALTLISCMTLAELLTPHLESRLFMLNGSKNAYIGGFYRSKIMVIVMRMTTKIIMVNACCTEIN